MNNIPLDVYNIIAIRKPKSVGMWKSCCDTRGFYVWVRAAGVIILLDFGYVAGPVVIYLCFSYYYIRFTVQFHGSWQGIILWVRGTKRKDTWRQRRSLRRGITLVTHYIYILYGSIVQQSMLSNWHQWPFYLFIFYRFLDDRMSV